MKFIIESADHSKVDAQGTVPPTNVTELKAELEASRDEWLRTTPQLTNRGKADDPAKFKDGIAEVDDNIARNINEKKAPWVKRRAKLIEELSATLDETHTGVKAIMDRAIASAVLYASSATCAVRVTISGHFKPGSKDGVHNRVQISVDDAAHG
jgi:hypothetical protein